MATKKLDNKPTMKTWIWLKGPKSKALEDLRDVKGMERTIALCGRWLQSTGIDSDGDFRMAEGIDPGVFYKREVAHVQESVECPKDPPAKVVHTKKPKAKSVKKHVWEPKYLSINPKSTRANLHGLLRDVVHQINDLGTENAKLKNQIASLKKKGTK